MILKGKSGAEAELPINLFDFSTGEAILGHTFTTGEVLLALPNGVLEDATPGNIVEKGHGRYALQLTGAETSTSGAVVLHLVTDPVSGPYLPHAWDETIVDVGATARDAILDYAFRSGRTIRGFFRRVDALFFNKNTGLKNSNHIAYQPGGSNVPEYTDTQDVVAGTRSEANVANSEAP